MTTPFFFTISTTWLPCYLWPCIGLKRHATTRHSCSELLTQPGKPQHQLHYVMLHQPAAQPPAATSLWRADCFTPRATPFLCSVSSAISPCCHRLWEGASRTPHHGDTNGESGSRDALQPKVEAHE